MNNNYSLPSLFNSQNNSDFIVFTLSDKYYAVNINSIVEVIKLTKIEIPLSTPKSVVGMINYNGTFIKVVDLFNLLGFDTPQFSIDNHLIIIKHNDEFIALLVENILNITKLSPENIQQLPFSVNFSLISQVFKDLTYTINIIDTEQIFVSLNSNAFTQNEVNYTSLLPNDSNSVKILEYRHDLIKEKTQSFSFPIAFESNNKFILFVIDNQNYYLDLKYVKEFITINNLKITKLPYTQKCIRGIINMKGDFLVVVDLKCFLDNSSQYSPKNGKFIIVQCQNFNIAFLVDDIKHITDLEINKILNVNSQSNSPYILCEFMENNELYSILNIERILNDEKLYINIK